MLSGVINSVRGNLITRFRDPVVGSFLIAWCVCNWDKLAILFLGSDEAELRIIKLSKNISVIKDPGLLLSDWALLINPIAITLLYLFVFPRFSLWVRKKQNAVILSQHDHTIDLDIRRVERQKELSKIKLRANPEKEFLAKEVENDLQNERERSQRRNKIKEYIDSKTKAAKAEADMKFAEAENKKIDLDKKKLQDEVEKRRFEMQAAIYKSTAASARFPVIYNLMVLLSHNLWDDGVVLSVDGLSNTIAALFGYSDGEEMMNDNKFQAESFNNVLYVYHDVEFFVGKIKEIVGREKTKTKSVEVLEGLLFDSVLTMLETFSLELLSAEALAEKIGESINEMQYDVMNSDEVLSAMAATDTIYDSLELEVSEFRFVSDFEVEMTGYARGYHRTETDVYGQELRVNIKAIATPVIGKFGLSEFKLKKINAEPVVL